METIMIYNHDDINTRPHLLSCVAVTIEKAGTAVMEFLENLLKAFIPMFVAVDVVGVTPFFINVTRGIKGKAKKKLIVQSVITATLVTVVFLFVGQALFDFLGIEIPDFMIAGGIIIFIIASHDLISREKARVTADPTIGVVPLGTPLLAGPAVLATAIIINKPYGLPATLISILLNFFVAGVVFYFSDTVLKLLGENGSRALSKIMALVLCAFGVMMIRKGIMTIAGLI